jgi:hypothetical protein
MAYNVVDFNKAKADLKADRDQQARFRDFDPKEFDRTAIASLRKLVNEAVRIEEDVHKRINDEYGRAKRLMDQLEGLVKKKGKKLDGGDANLIDVMTRTIEEATAKANQASTDARNSIEQWRNVGAGWPELFSDPKLFEKEMAPREKTLKFGPADESLRKRMGEYVTRAKNYQKLAHQTATRGAAQQEAEDVVIKQFTDDAKDGLKNIKANALKVTNDIDTFVTKPMDRAKNATTAADVKTWEQALAAAEQKAKGVRGELKSFEILLATFKKRAGMFDATNRKDAEKAYTDAVKLVKEAQTKAKDLAALQTKAAKAVAQAKKTAKK